MNTYKYTALNKDDLYVKGQIKAMSQKKAVAKLEKQGFLVINIKKVVKYDWQNIVVWSTISRLDKIYLTRHLHTFLEAGISMDKSVKIASEQVANKKMEEILKAVHKDVTEGQRLSTAFNKYKKYFSSYFINLIKIGEESGTLDEVLKHLLEQQEKEYELIQKARGAMIYPLVIVAAAIVIVIFMMSFVVPTLTTVLTEYDTELPLPTKILIFISNSIVHYGFIMLGALVFLAVGLRALVKTKKGKIYYERLLFRLPIIKKIVLEYNIARFTRAVSAPLLSGISIDISLQLAADTCENYHFKESIEKAVTVVRKGINLSEVLIGFPRLYPPSVTRMIEIGEQTGKFDHMFKRLARFYETSVTNTLSNLSSVIEPFLLIGIGLTVGFIAVSILTPIWKLVETI